MKISSSKLKKLLFFFLGEPLRFFHSCFFRWSPSTIDFYYCFRVFSLLIAFVHFTKLRVFHHCFFRCFFFTTVYTIVFRVFSFHQLSSPGLFFVRYFIFVLLYCACYGFERAFLTLRHFLLYTPS